MLNDHSAVRLDIVENKRQNISTATRDELIIQIRMSLQFIQSIFCEHNLTQRFTLFCYHFV